MTHAHAASAPPVPWARLQILRGDSPQTLLFTHGVPARVVVGSEPTAHMRLSAPEVAPRQLDVIWDGENLWLEDALRLGRTFVNGRLLNEWTPILGQAVISFAQIRLWVLADGVAPSVQVPNFSALERASVLNLQHGAERRKNTARLTLPPDLLELVKRDGVF